MAFNFLVVDDERLSRSYIRNMLLRYNAGFTVLEAASGREAAGILAAQPVDVVFLDIKMPEADGFALLDMLPHRDFELVFITAYNQYAIKAIKEGASDYLLKPIKRTDFIKALEVAIRRREQAREFAEADRARHQLTETQELLREYIDSIHEKNDTIEQLQAELEQLQGRGAANEKYAALDELQRNAILTEDDWATFKEKFDAVHPSFFLQLKEKYAGLTQAEVRLMALTRLSLSTREMASMLGISPETIRQTRWRLRKKMDLPDDLTLEHVASAI